VSDLGLKLSPAKHLSKRCWWQLRESFTKRRGKQCAHCFKRYTLAHEDVFHAGGGCVKPRFDGWSSTGDETVVCDSSLKLVLFGTHTKQRLGHMLRVPVRVKLLLSFQPHWIFVVTRIGRGIKSGEQRRRRRHPRGNAEFSVSGNHG
jgi:hypothetical protein